MSRPPLEAPPNRSRPSPGLSGDALVALNAAPLGRDAVCRLARAPTPWAAGIGLPLAALAAETGVSGAELERALEALAQRREIARRERRAAARHGARILTLGCPGYPPSLLDLDLPPPVLYVAGELPPRPALAMVGSRRAGPYGLEVAAAFARELAAHGLTIVSGLARGVDTAAHRGALAAGGGLTVAVLGCGLDSDYPRGSAALRQRIARRGAVVSEFPCACAPHAYNFPIRNRIIAALALGTLVVRAAPRSGSLITARLALELGRDVYAVPGAIFDERSAGANSLIRDGALLAQNARDILESLPTAVRQRLETAAEDDTEPPTGADARRLLELLPIGATLSQDELASRAGLPIERALALVLELELDGHVRRYPGPRFSRRS